MTERRRQILARRRAAIDPKNMYWWRIEPLKAQLLSGGPPESEKMKYLLATAGAHVISAEAGYLIGVSDSTALTSMDWISALLTIACTFIGIYYCYRRNLAGDGQRFLERFICVSWPVSVRFFVCCVGILLGYAVLGHVIGGEAFALFFENDQIVPVTLFVLAEIIFYWYLACHIHDVSTRSAVSDNAADRGAAQ